MSAESINKVEIEAKMFQLSNTTFVKGVLFIIIFSYFMNLPVLFYSIKGDNEFRIYDLIGPFLVYIFYQEKVFFKFIIKNHIVFRRLYRFLIWSTFSLLITLFFAAFLEKLVWFLQCVLYVYHFWVFYLTAVLLFVVSINFKLLKNIIYFILLLSSLNCLIVIFQNIGLIPFLWSIDYFKGYNGFLSGTMGPNKIVLGMSNLMISVLCIGLLLESKVTLIKAFIYIALALSLVVIILSGSRTTYVGLMVFLVWFFLRDFGKFIYFGSLISIVIVVLVTTENPIIGVVTETIEGRVVAKIRNPTDLQEGNVGNLYEDLGSGRSEIALKYIDYLIENPYVIPFGIGINNRLIMEGSAHNIYLSLIGEVGVFGFILYFTWMGSYFLVKLEHFKSLQLALRGLVISMLVTLFFGEHLYIYRPVFALLGIFLVVTTILTSPILLAFQNYEGKNEE